MVRKIIEISEEKCSGCGACAAACHEGAIGMVDGKAKLLRDDYCDGLGDCLPSCPTGAIKFVEREAAAYDEDAVLAAKAQKKQPLACGCPKLDEGNYADKLTEIIRHNSIRSVTVVRMEVPCCGGIEMAAKTALQNSRKFIPWNVVTIATDGSILPAHAYPELRKHAHLKGNFGTAWQNQKKEFASLPAPVLFTTNCLIPPSSLSPNVLDYLVKNFGIHQISTPEQDMAEILN